MVKKKLNFSQPILSVRRNSPKMAPQIVDQNKGDLPVIHWLSHHRPEPNSGPVRNPGSIPFLWEQSPGRPKEEIIAQSHSGASPLVSAELPPSSETEAQETSPNFDASSEPVVHERYDLGSNALVLQQEEERRKVVDQEKAVVLHCRPSFEREGSDQHENVITVCCLLPRSCLKNLVWNVNPVPAMSRVMTFPCSRMLSESAVSGSSSDSENEYAVIQTSKLNDSNNQQGRFFEETLRKKSFKTLQELLVDDSVKNVDREDVSGSDVKTSGEMKMITDSDSDQDSDSENDIRLAVTKAAEYARKRLARGSVVPPPPLPESPSDSWLSRTMSSASARKVSRSAFVSQFSNKY